MRVQLAQLEWQKLDDIFFNTSLEDSSVMSLEDSSIMSLEDSSNYAYMINHQLISVNYSIMTESISDNIFFLHVIAFNCMLSCLSVGLVTDRLRFRDDKSHETYFSPLVSAPCLFGRNTKRLT